MVIVLYWSDHHEVAAEAPTSSGCFYQSDLPKELLRTLIGVLSLSLYSAPLDLPCKQVAFGSSTTALIHHDTMLSIDVRKEECIGTLITDLVIDMILVLGGNIAKLSHHLLHPRKVTLVEITGLEMKHHIQTSRSRAHGLKPHWSRRIVWTMYGTVH